MKIGTLEIQLMADMARLKRDMDDAKGSVFGAMGAIENSVSGAKAAFLSLGGVASVALFGNMINAAIESAAALKDMSIATGASVESLSRFGEVGRTTGTTTETIAGLMNKLSKATVDAKDGTHGAGAAISALGINFDTFKKMSPDEKLTTVATAMNGFRDGSEKSAVAMSLLGKQGALALPFLKDLAEQGDIVARVTEAQATASDNFSDNLTLLKTSGEAWKTELAMGMVPALDNATTAMVSVFNETGGLRDELRKLSADGSIASWTTSAITGVTYVMDVFSGLKAVVVSIGSVIGAWAASVGETFGTLFGSVSKAISRDFSGAMDSMKSLLNNQKAIVSGLGDTLADTWGEKTLGARLRERMSDMRAVGDTTEAQKPKLDTSKLHDENAKAMKAEQAEIKKQADAYASLTSSLDAKIASSERELSTTGKVTDANKALDKLNADLASGVLKLTDSQIAQTAARINSLDALQRHIEMQKEEKKLQDDISKDMEEVNKQLQARTDNLVKDNDALAEHNAAIGLDERALVARTAAQLIANAELLEGTAATKDDSGAALTHAGQLTKQAQLLRDRAGLLQEGIVAKEAAEAKKAWEATTKAIGQGLTDVFMNSITTGKDLWVGFRDYIVNLFKQMVLTPTINTILNPVAKTISDGLQSAFGVGQQVAGAVTGNSGEGANPTGTLGTVASTVSAATSAVGTSIGNTLGSIGSSIGSALGFTGTGTGAAATGATATAVTGGTNLVATSLPALGAETAATSAAASAGTGALAVAGPIAAAVGGFLLIDSLSSSGTTARSYYKRIYDAAGVDISPTQPDGSPGGSGRLVLRQPELSKVTDQLAKDYVSLAKSLGISPERTEFAYDNEGGSFRLQLDMNGANYQSGNQPGSAATLEWAKKRAIFAALQGSDKPSNIAALFDGRNAGLMGFDEINNALAAAAAAPPDGAYAPGQLLGVIQYLRSQGASPADIKAAGLSNFGIAEIYTKGIADAAGIPGFAAGGMFSGGLRIVGERGPELEATGPSRIFNASETASMLRSGGATNAELATEMAAIRRTLERMQLDTKRTADATNGNGEAPMIVEIEA